MNQTVEFNKSENERAVKLYRRMARLVFLTINILLVTAVFTLAQSNLDDLKFKISNGSTEEKRNALFAIRSVHNAEASTIAIPALTDADPLVRATAASSVVFLPKDEAAKILIPMLADKVDFVRMETAVALGKTASTTATQPLLDLLKREKNAEVRNAVVSSLGHIGDTAAIETLTAILKKNPSEDTELLRRSAARSIGQIAQMLLTGTTKVDTPFNFLPEKYKQPGTPDAAEKIGQFPAFKTAIVTLTKVLLSNKEADDTRRETAFALGSIGDPASAAPLRSNLNSPDNYLAEICKEALLKIEQPK